MAALAGLVTAVALAGLTYWTTRAIDREAEREILAELEDLQGHHRERGWESLAQEIDRRSNHGRKQRNRKEPKKVAHLMVRCKV